MKRIALVALAAAIAFTTYLPFMAITPQAAAESDDWCDTDPIVVITTPAGNLVPIYNTNGAQGLAHQPSVVAAKVTYTVTPINGGTATAVKLNVTIPNDIFGSNYATRTKISTGPWGTLNVLGSTTGTSGSAMTVQFTLNVP